MTDLFTETWGRGTRVVLVHGSLATGSDEWQMQRALADHGFELVVLDQRDISALARYRYEDLRQVGI